jgi:hypothetical protein
VRGLSASDKDLGESLRERLLGGLTARDKALGESLGQSLLGEVIGKRQSSGRVAVRVPTMRGYRQATKIWASHSESACWEGERHATKLWARGWESTYCERLTAGNKALGELLGESLLGEVNSKRQSSGQVAGTVTARRAFWQATKHWASAC